MDTGRSLKIPSPEIDTKAIAKAFDQWCESKDFPLLEDVQTEWLEEAFKRGYIAGLTAKGKR